MEASRQKVTESCNIQFYQTLNSKARIKIHQGGTRSGKTYAICQYLVYRITTAQKPLTIDIVRKTLPAIKGSVQRDLIGILQRLGIYYKGVHNKSENTFTYNGCTISFSVCRRTTENTR
jgi:phage terminase large subunit